MDMTLLKNELTRYEGYSETVYRDTKGLATVGIGHMDNSMTVGDVYSAEQVEAFFEADITNAVAVANHWLAGTVLDDVRYRVMVQLAFNLGNKLGQFVHFLAALKSGDFATAAAQLKASAWFNEVGHRGPETCYAIQTGGYQWE